MNDKIKKPEKITDYPATDKYDVGYNQSYDVWQAYITQTVDECTNPKCICSSNSFHTHFCAMHLKTMAEIRKALYDKFGLGDK